MASEEGGGEGMLQLHGPSRSTLFSRRGPPSFLQGEEGRGKDLFRGHRELPASGARNWRLEEFRTEVATS